MAVFTDFSLPSRFEHVVRVLTWSSDHLKLFAPNLVKLNGRI
jgi:hypothetical protein